MTTIALNFDYDDYSILTHEAYANSFFPSAIKFK